MQYALENIVALINRKEPLPVTFTRALTGVCKQALHRGIYPIEVQQLFADMCLELPASYFVEPDGIINADCWYKIVRILERSGICIVPLSVPSNLSIYQTVYLLKRPDITSDADIATLQRLVAERKERHTVGELETITRAKEKLSNYNIMLRVFEFLGAAQVRSLDANQRSVLQTILDEHPLPHDGMRYIRTLYSYACDIGSYHYDYSEPKYVLPKLPDAEHSTALDIVARTIAPSHQAIKIPDNFPYKRELAEDYQEACPKIFVTPEQVEAPRRPLSLRPLSEINSNQRQRRLEQRLERVLEPLRSAQVSLAQLQGSSLVQAIEAKTGTAFDWEDQNDVVLARELHAAKLRFDEEKRIEDEQMAQKEAEAAANLAAALAAQKKSRNKRKTDTAEPVVSDAARVIAEAVRAAAAAKKSAVEAQGQAGTQGADSAQSSSETSSDPAETRVEAQDDWDRFDYGQYAQGLDVAALAVNPAAYYDDLKSALPEQIDRNQVTLLMMTKGVRTGFDAGFLNLLSAALGSCDPELSAQMALLADELKHDENVRLMLPDFSKTKLCCYFNGYDLAVAPLDDTWAAPVLAVPDACTLDLSAEVSDLVNDPMSVDNGRELLQQAQNSLYEAYLAAIEERYNQEQEAQLNLDAAGTKSKRLRRKLTSEQAVSFVPSATKRSGGATQVALVDPNDFKGEWSGEHLGRTFDYSVNQLNENKIAFARWVNLGEFEALQRACSLGALERFHLVPWVWDELSFLHHSYLVWNAAAATDPEHEVARDYPDLNQDYGSNLKQFVLNPLKQKARLDQVMCFELVLRPLFAPLHLERLGAGERAALQLLALAHYNFTVQKTVDLIPAAFYHGLVYFERYLQHPEEHVNLERFYLAVARANPYAFNLFLTRVVEHFGPKLSAIPEQFFELIVLNLVLFAPKDQGTLAHNTWRLLKDDSFSASLPLNVIALRLMARTLYCLVQRDPSFQNLELTQVSSESLTRQLREQDALIAQMHEVRLSDGTALKQGHAQAYALLQETNPKYVKTLLDLTQSVAAAELKQAGFKLVAEAASNDPSAHLNSELTTLVTDIVQHFLSTGELPEIIAEQPRPEPDAHLARAPASVKADYAKRFELQPKAHLERAAARAPHAAPPTLGAAQALAQAAAHKAGAKKTNAKKTAGADFFDLGGAGAQVVSSERSANSIAAKARADLDFFDLDDTTELSEQPAEQTREQAPEHLAEHSPFAEFFDDDAAIAAQAQAERRAARSAHKGMGALEAGELDSSSFGGSSFLAQAMSAGLKALQAAKVEAEPEEEPEVAVEPEPELPLSLNPKAKSIIALSLKSALSVLPLPKMAQAELKQAEDQAVLAQLFAEHKDWIYGLTAANCVALNPDFAHRTLAWSNPEFNALSPQVASLCTKYVAPVVRRVLCQNEDRFYTLARIIDLKALYDLSIRGSKLSALLFNQGYQQHLPLMECSIYGVSYNRLLQNMVLYGFGPLGSLHLLKEDFAPSATEVPVNTLESLGRSGIRQVPELIKAGEPGVSESKPMPDPVARVEEWSHRLTHKLKAQLSSEMPSAEVEAALSAQRPISLLACLSAYYEESKLEGPTKFWADCDLERAQRLEQLLLNTTTSAALGFNSGVLEQEMLDLGRLCEDNFGLCLVPSPSLLSPRFSFKLLRAHYQHLRFVVIPPELLVTSDGREFYLRLKATLYYAYLALELTAALAPVKGKRGLVRMLARYIVTMYASQGRYKIERLVLEYLQGALNIILADGPLLFEDLMLRTLHLYSGNDVNSLNLQLDHIQQLQRFLAVSVSYELGQNREDHKIQLRYINLLARMFLTPVPTADCHNKAHKVASMVSSYFFEPNANENLLRSGIFWNLRTYHEPENLVLDLNKIRSKLLESAQVQDVITKLREEESGVDESGPSLSEALAQQQAAAAAESTASTPAASTASAPEPKVEEAPQAAAPTEAECPVAALNPKLHKVIEALAVQATDAMVYGEFNGICVSYGLLSGNYAIEVLNEFSYEHYDEPLLELDGSGNSAIVYLSVDLIAQLHEQCRKLKPEA